MRTKARRAVRLPTAVLVATAAIADLAEARAMPPVRPSAEGGLSVDVIDAAPQSFFGALLELPFADGLEGGLGLRLFTANLEPDPSLSGYFRVSLAARHAFWRPALGWELELMAPNRPEASGAAPTSLTEAFHESSREHLLWSHVVLEPARFQWERLFFATGAFAVGTSLDEPAGSRLRLRFTLLRLGWVLP